MKTVVNKQSSKIPYTAPSVEKTEVELSVDVLTSSVVMVVGIEKEKVDDTGFDNTNTGEFSTDW